MISRVWHGWTSRDHADAYQRLLLTTILPGIRARAIPGYRGVRVERRTVADDVEFVTTMLFDSLDAVVAFAGEAYETAVVPASARALLTRFDYTAAHYEVLESLDAEAPDLRAGLEQRAHG